VSSGHLPDCDWYSGALLQPYPYPTSLYSREEWAAIWAGDIQVHFLCTTAGPDSS